MNALPLLVFNEGGAYFDRVHSDRQCQGSARRAYLRREALDEDGDEQVEQHVVAEGHEGDEVERRPMASFLHTVKQYHVPVLLRQDLSQNRLEHEATGLSVAALDLYVMTIVHLKLSASAAVFILF